MLIRAYRARGHFHANLDPLGLEPRKNEEELDPRSYGFTDADMDRRDLPRPACSASNSRTLREILAILRRTYCQTLGVEFMHISDPAQKGWMQERIEGPDKEISFTREGKRAILNKLIEAEGFENFCDLKFTGTKRFGLDGGESMIPALEQIIKRGGALGVKEIVLGMAHRGRLNVLAQVMGKPHRVIFHEFKGGSATPERRRRLRRREVSPRRLVRPRVRRQQGASVADRQSRRISRSSCRSRSARCAPSRTSYGATPRGPHHGDAAADPRRRGVRRAGRDRGMLRPLRPARPPHRRLGAFHRQQPDRLHHLSALFALVAVSVRRRQDDRGADLPRERRRSGGGGLRRQGRDRVPAEIPEAGRHRHVLLPPLRPQRGRRAGVHPAADVQGDPRASLDARRSTPRSSSARASSPRARSRRCAPTGAPGSMSSWRRARATRPTAPTGSTAAGPTSRRRATRTIRAAATPASTLATLKEIGDKITAVPQGLPRPPHHPALPRQPPQGDRDRRGHRLGDRRGAGVLLADARRPSGAAVRPGRRARHLLAAPFGADRPGERGPLHPVQPARREAGALRGRQLDALGGGRARLRVRLFAGRAERADAVGGAVRRLRQRRAGRVRPVHLVGRAQVAAHVGPRLPAAARLRRAGAGAFLGAARALPADVRRGQHAGRELHDAGELLPHPAPAAEARHPQAADPDDAEVAAAPQARGVAARRDGAGHHVPSPAVGRRAAAAGREDQARRRRQDPPRRDVLAARSISISTRSARSAASTTSICCASSSSIRCR